MSVYAISDLHLAVSIDKPMDIFGVRWSNYMEKLQSHWINTIGEDDYVIIPGDISWATYLEQSIADFKYINALPGRKIISKGNHDYWWTTLNKLNCFLEENEFTTISFMHNNSFNLGDFILCGTRGWKCPGEEDFSAEDRKVYNRELQRLELSLKSIQRSNQDLIVSLHYPPFNAKKEASEFIGIMKKYNVNTCIYGHLHGESCKNAVTGSIDGINFKLISADNLEFKPLLITRET